MSIKGYLEGNTMMGESKLINEFREYFDGRMNRLEDKIDEKFNSFCDHCQNSATFKERFHTIFRNLYALWGIVGTAVSAMLGLLIYILQGHLR